MKPDPMKGLFDALVMKGCEPRGEVWKFTARCPVHEDRRPSLSVQEGADGRALVHCHALCDTDAIVKALGLVMADLYPSGHHKGHRKPPVVKRAPAPAEALLMALTRIGAEWSGLIHSECPYCEHPALWWKIRAAGVDVECPNGCSRDEVLRALDNAVWFTENPS